MCMCVTVVIESNIWGYYSIISFSFLFLDLSFTFWLKCANRTESWYVNRADSAAGVENGMFAQQMLWQGSCSLPRRPQQLLVSPSR